MEAVLPVKESVRHWFASPRAAVRFLMHAAALDTTALGSRRSLTMPGLTATVGEEIEALRRVAGDKAVKLIRHEPDETIVKMVAGWPQNFDASRAIALGFEAETSFDEIIRAHVEDELGGDPSLDQFIASRMIYLLLQFHKTFPLFRIAQDQPIRNRGSQKGHRGTPAVPDGFRGRLARLSGRSEQMRVRKAPWTDGRSSRRKPAFGTRYPGDQGAKDTKAVREKFQRRAEIACHVAWRSVDLR